MPAGRYRLDEVTTPAGYQPADNQGIDVVAGAPTEVTVEYRQARGRPGRLVILVTDENGDPVPQTCFDVRGPVELTEVCDRQDDGRLNVPDLPAGEYTVTQTRTAEGFTPAAETSVVVPEDDTIELPLVNARAETGGQAQEEQQPKEGEQTTPENGSLAIVAEELEDGGDRLPVACYTVEMPPGGQAFGPFCDEDGDGEVTVQGVTPGPIAVVESTPPPDTEPADPARQEVEIVTGEEAQVIFRHGPAAQEQEPGTLVIFVENEDGERIGGTCFTLQGETENQPLTDVCDQGDDGRLNFPDLPSGDYTIVQTRAGENRQLAPEQTVTVEPGQTVEVTLLNPREPEPATPTPQPEQTPPPRRSQKRPRSATPEPVATAEQPVETGMLSVVNLAPDGSPLGDGCLRSPMPPTYRCRGVRQRRQRFRQRAGSRRLRRIPAGQYTLTQTAAAEGFSPAAPRQSSTASMTVSRW